MRFISALFVVGLFCASGYAAGYETRGLRVFENEILTHRCKQLYVDGKPVTWVTGEMKSAYGLITQICEEKEEPYPDAATAGSVFGGVKEGWYLVDSVGNATRIMLPLLGYFSNPTVCGRFMAYWGDKGDKVDALVVSEIKEQKIVREISIGPLLLETDNPSHLRAPTWSKDCREAVFKDDRYIKITTLVPSNLR